MNWTKDKWVYLSGWCVGVGLGNVLFADLRTVGGAYDAVSIAAVSLVAGHLCLRRYLLLGDGK